jgi:hypothetical protein
MLNVIKLLRGFAQVHLSTVILTTILAGILLGLNLVDRDIKPEYQAWYAKDYVAIVTWGWPCRYGEAGQFNNLAPDWTADSTTSLAPQRNTMDVYRDEHGNLHFRYLEVDYIRSGVINLAVCWCLCLAFMALCECSIRRALQRTRKSSGELHVVAENLSQAGAK